MLTLGTLLYVGTPPQTHTLGDGSINEVKQLMVNRGGCGKSTGTERSTVVTRRWEKEWSRFQESRVSVWENERGAEMDGGDGCVMMRMSLTRL